MTAPLLTAEDLLKANIPDKRTETDPLVGEDVLPGFRCVLTSIL